MARQMRPRWAPARCDRLDPPCRREPARGRGRGAIMDSSEWLSQFSIDRLDGDPVPDDLQILLPERDELARRSGIRLVPDEDWAPWLDTSGLAEAVRSDPDAAADLRARAEVCRLCAFVAVD